MSEDSLLSLHALVIGHDRRGLSEPMTCTIPKGACVGIIGSNGSGKTTFVKTILGLTPAVRGSYRWEANSSFGYVPQENRLNTLFPITVTDLIKMGTVSSLSRFKASSEAFEAASATALSLLEIAALKNRLVRELSGGQRQRALIARALAACPNVIIFDEPLNSLDYAFKQRFWGLLSELRAEQGVSTFLIEHDLNRAINHVDWLVVLGPNGTLYGPKESVLDEASLSDAFQSPVRILRGSHDQVQVQFL